MSGAASGVVLGLLLATAYAAAFHFLTGGSLGRLIFYLLASWLGFTAGHFMGDFFGFTVLSLGTVNLLSASLGSWIALFFSWWLAGANS